MNLTLDPPAFLPIVLFLLWFYSVWQTYVIEETQARLAGLQEVWLETLSQNAAWSSNADVRIVQSLLDSGRQRLPQLSAAPLLIAALLPSRERLVARLRVYEALLRLPSPRLQEQALSIVEAGARFVVLAVLKRCLLVWLLSPLYVAAFIVWTVHWHLRTVAKGAPQGSLRLARLRLRGRVLKPLIAIVMSPAPT